MNRVFLIAILILTCPDATEALVSPRVTQEPCVIHEAPMALVSNSSCAPLAASTYYVDGNNPAASDTNPGTIDKPWKTLERAAQAAGAGDTVFLRNGIYNEQLVTQRDGSLSAGYIVFIAYPGERPIIDGTGVPTGNNGIVITHSYIAIQNLVVRNWNDNAMWIVNAGWVLICGCEVHDVTYGIGLADGTHDFNICNTVAHHFDYYGFDASPSGGAACYNGMFRKCKAHTGRDRQQNVDGFALGHGLQKNFVLEDCETYDVFDGFDISSANTTLIRCSAHGCWNGGYKLWQDRITLANCLGYNNAGSNVELDWDGEPGASTLLNCTFHNAGTFGIWVENAADTLKMYNCILAGNDNIGLAFEQLSIATYRGDYNLFHNDSGTRLVIVGYQDEFAVSDFPNWTSYAGQDGNSFAVSSDQGLFVNPANGDFHLAKGSAAIDMGMLSIAPTTDYDGKPRPYGKAVDIGAFEYQGETHVHSPALPGPIKLDVYPNPMRNGAVMQVIVAGQDPVEIRVVNLLGQSLRRICCMPSMSGGSVWHWDGRDETGSPVPAGLYKVEASSGRMPAVRYVLVIR